MPAIRFVRLDAELVAVVEPWFEDADTILFLGDRAWIRRELQLLESAAGAGSGNETSEGRDAWIAFERNAPVGYIGVERYADRRAACVLVVDPNARRRGIARELLLCVWERPELAETEELFGGVALENAASRLCLASAGFSLSEEADAEGMLEAWRAGPPTVHLMCGLVCAGKTTVARRLASEVPAVRFTLDEWMLRLYGGRHDAPEYVARLEVCKALMWETALQVLGAGHDVLLDWNQWNRERRAEWRDRAHAATFPVALHFVDVPIETAVQRASDRAARGTQHVHQFGEEGVRHFATIFEPPTAAEGFRTVTH